MSDDNDGWGQYNAAMEEVYDLRAEVATLRAALAAMKTTLAAAIAEERERCAAIADTLRAQERKLQRQASADFDYERAGECGAAADVAEGIANRIRQPA